MSALAASSVVLTLLFHRPDADAIDHPYPGTARLPPYHSLATVFRTVRPLSRRNSVR